MARNFSGTAQYLADTSQAIVSSPPFTIAAWARHDTLKNYSVVAGVQAASTNHCHRLFSDSAGTLTAQSFSASGGSATKAGLTTGTWQHVAGVWASTSSRTAYVNGVAGTTNTTAISPTVDRTVVATSTKTGAEYYLDGQIAEVAFWSAALSADEIAALADGVSPFLVRPASLVSYAKIMGRSSPEPDEFGAVVYTLTGASSQFEHPPMRYPGRVQSWKYGAGSPPAGLAAHPFFGGGTAANPIWGYA